MGEISVGPSAQHMKHENAQKFSSEISPIFRPESHPTRKNVSLKFRSGGCQAQSRGELGQRKKEARKAVRRSIGRQNLHTNASRRGPPQTPGRLFGVVLPVVAEMIIQNEICFEPEICICHRTYLEFKRESVPVCAMDTNFSGSEILYLELKIDSPQKKCLSVINMDTTVYLRAPRCGVIFSRSDTKLALFSVKLARVSVQLV